MPPLKHKQAKALHDRWRHVNKIELPFPEWLTSSKKTILVGLGFGNLPQKQAKFVWDARALLMDDILPKLQLLQRRKGCNTRKELLILQIDCQYSQTRTESTVDCTSSFFSLTRYTYLGERGWLGLWWDRTDRSAMTGLTGAGCYLWPDWWYPNRSCTGRVTLPNTGLLWSSSLRWGGGCSIG